MASAGHALIFDGQCSVCTRAVRWLQVLDRRNRIAIHPSQGVGVREQFGLSVAQTEASLWAISPSGERLAGAAAVSRALDVALGVQLFSRINGVRRLGALQERTYQWVARNRHRLPGVTPWCTQHPAECEPAQAGASCSRP